MFHLIAAVMAAVLQLGPGDTAVCNLPTAVPTPTVTATAVPTAAPTPVSCVKITSPADGSMVSGTVAIHTSDGCPGAWWEQLLVDGAESGGFSPGEAVIDTAALDNGTHHFVINSQSKNPGSVVLGSDSVTLNVQNSAQTPSPSRTPAPPTPTGAPTPSPAPTSVACTSSPALNITSSGDYDGTGKCASTITISASNVNVHGWDVSNQSNNYGIWVKSGSNVTVQSNRVHDLCREGINLNSGVSGAKILGNVVVHASMAGIMVNGTNDEVAFNEVSDTVQYPKAEGGKFSSCTNNGGADADCMRWFGSGHDLHDNYCHDIANDWGSARNKDPHVDCIQTWGPLTDSHFHHNRCMWNNANGSVDREFCEHEMLNGTQTGRLTFDHNVFTGGRDGCMFEAPITGITFTQNTEVGFLNGGVNVYTSGNTIGDNIVYDGGANSAAWRCDGSASGVTNNDRYLPQGSYGTYGCSTPDAIKKDPLFVLVPPGGFAGYADGDYHLKPNSPVPTLGAYPLTGADENMSREGRSRQPDMTSGDSRGD